MRLFVRFCSLEALKYCKKNINTNREMNEIGRGNDDPKHYNFIFSTVNATVSISKTTLSFNAESDSTRQYKI